MLADGEFFVCGHSPSLRSLLFQHVYQIDFPQYRSLNSLLIDAGPIRKSKIVALDEEVYVRDGNITLKLDGLRLYEWGQTRKKG